MCGIIGIFDDNSVNQSLFDGLTVLQHRGQDSAGIATCLDNNLHQKKNLRRPDHKIKSYLLFC